MSTEEDNSPKRKKCGPSFWKRNINKEARKSGLEYVNTAGNVVPAKQMGPKCECKKKCLSDISTDEANEAFKYFLQLNTKDEQDVFLQNLIGRNPPARRRPRVELQSSSSSSRLTYTYNVLVGERTMPVCRQSFLSFYSISMKRLRRINELAKLGISPKDMRGKCKSANATADDVLLKIHSHIDSFPTETSQHSGTIIKYLHERLSVKKLWAMYLVKHPGSEVGMTTFLNYFEENFDLKFGQPQVNCCECEMLTTKIKSDHISDSAKQNAEAELMVHKRIASQFDEKLELEKAKSINVADPEDDTVVAIYFDYMQNLTIPVIPVEDTFYLRHVNINIFCIHNIRRNTSKFYIYHEGDGKKGSNEVCTFLLDYLKNEIPDSTSTLHLYSDNCAGQNKNHTLSKMLLAITEMKLFDKIEQYYPIKGHSFVPCDHHLSKIKKKYKKFDTLYTIQQITDIILPRSKKSKFQVKEVHAEDILNFKQWWPKHFKRNPNAIGISGRKTPKEAKIQFGIANFHRFTFNSESPGIVDAYNLIDDYVKHTFSMRKGTTLDLPTQKAYPMGKIPLNQDKVNDLKKLQSYMPEEFRTYFDLLINWPTTNHDMEVDDNIE